MDKYLGIDVIITRHSGDKITICEKIRSYDIYKKYSDEITLEYKNGDNTPGEFYYCIAQYYFYMFESPKIGNICDFKSFNMVDLKSSINKFGGLERCPYTSGPIPNYEHGKSWFYALKYEDLIKNTDTKFTFYRGISKCSEN
jgi:hypothetical protein